MAAMDRVIDAVRDVLRMTDEIKRLSENVKQMAQEVRDHDRRLIRLETMVEVAKAQAGNRKHLPPA